MAVWWRAKNSVQKSPPKLFNTCFSCFMPSFNKFSSCAHSVADTVLGARDPAVNKTDNVPGFSTKAIPGSLISLSSWAFWLHSLSGQLLDVKSAKFPTWSRIVTFQQQYIIAKASPRSKVYRKVDSWSTLANLQWY